MSTSSPFSKLSSLYRPTHRKTFAAIVKIYLRGDIPNVLTLIEDLKKSGELQGVGIELVYSLMEYANNTAAFSAITAETEQSQFSDLNDYLDNCCIQDFCQRFQRL